MSVLTIERLTTFDNHVILSVEPTGRRVDVDDLAERFADHGAQAVRMAGMLARIALDIASALDVTRLDHGCGRILYRDDSDPGAEVVDAWRAGCGAALITGDPDARHLLDDATMPSLTVHVPPNRERAWTARLERAIRAVLDVDRRTLTTPPDISDD